MPSKHLAPHPMLQYLMLNTRMAKKDIAKALGMTRKTLYEWEYGVTAYKEYMVKEIAAVIGYDMADMPDRIKRKAEEVAVSRECDARARLTAHLTEKATPTPPGTTAPPGTPANQWVRKPSQMSMSDVDIHRLWVRRALREGTAPPPPFNIMFPAGSISSLPKHMQWMPDPDLIAEARHNMHPYELRYIPAHRIADRHPLGLQITAGWYFFGADGKMMRESDKGKAQARIDKLKADEAKALDEFI